MDPKKIVALSLASALAGVGVGRATVPSSPAPSLERVCVEADGSAQVYLNDDGRKRQLLVPADHTLAIMKREGGKVVDTVPAGLSHAIKALTNEVSKLATK